MPNTIRNDIGAIFVSLELSLYCGPVLRHPAALV